MATGTTRVNDGLWHHVAFTKAGVAAKLYIDGVLRSSANLTGSNTFTNAGLETRIGGDKGDAAATYGGLMDEVRLYNVTLGTSDIATLYAQGDVQTGLIDWYKLDEGAGTTLIDSKGANTGSLQGAVSYTDGAISFDRTLRFDAFHFDGISQYATIPDNAAYSIPTTGGLTVSAWMRPSVNQFTKFEGTGYVNWLGKSDFGSPNHVEWQHRIYNLSNTETNMRNNESSFYIFSSTGGIGVSADYGKETTDVNRWNHYVGVADGNYVYLYKNGILKQRNLYSGTVTPADTTAMIYLAHADNNGYLQGDIGPVKIWNRALSAGEVQQDYCGTTVATGLVGNWIADQANSRYTDLSSNANHGTLVNSPTFISNAYVAARPSAAQRLENYAGNALSLNGSTQYGSIADGSQTGLSLGTNDFLLCAWAQLNTMGAAQTILAKTDTSHTDPGSAGSTGYDISLSTNSGGVIQFRTRSGASSQSISYPWPKDGQPHFVSLAFKRGSSGACQLWIDGQKVQQFSSFTADLTNNGPFTVGTDSGSTRAHFLNGRVFCVGVWSWVSMPNDYQQIIDDLYNRKATTYTTGLVSFWSLNSTPNDSQGTNNLTLTASPSYVAALTGRTVAS